MYLQMITGLKMGKGASLVGMPVIRNRGQISIGENGVLVSLPLANPIGLTRPCILETTISAATIRIGSNFGSSGICIISQTSVSIGDNVSIGANVTIMDTDLHSIESDCRRMGGSPASKPIVIGDDVWIGMNAVILKGVTINKGAVIGANVVVTKDVPQFARLVNSPSRLL